MKKNLLLFAGYPFIASLFLAALYLLLCWNIDYSAMIVSVLALYILALFVMYIIYAVNLKQEFWDNKAMRIVTAISALPLIYCIITAGGAIFDIAFYLTLALSVILIAFNLRDVAFFTMTAAVVIKVYLLTQEYFSLLSYALTPYHIAYIARDISFVFLLLSATKKHGNTGSMGYKKYGFISAFYIFAQTASHLMTVVINNEVYEAFQSTTATSVALIFVASVLALLDGGGKVGDSLQENEENEDENSGTEELVFEEKLSDYL